jgi:CheY-like chemotaxis protein
VNIAGKKILIVEDEVILAVDLECSLKEMGCCVVGCFINGEEAMPLLAQDRPDIVFIDINLSGGLNGIEISKRIKEEYGIPIVFMTGNTDDITLHKAGELDPVGILKKPMTDLQLSSILEKAFL